MYVSANRVVMIFRAMGRSANLEDGFAGTWVGHWVVVDIRTEEDRAKCETLVSDLIPYEIFIIDICLPRWSSSTT